MREGEGMAGPTTSTATPMTFASTSDVVAVDVDMGVAVDVGVVAVDVGVVAVDMIAWP